MRMLNQNSALTELHEGPHRQRDSLRSAGEQRIADPADSIAARFRAIRDKLIDLRSLLVDGDRRFTRMQRELQQLQREKADLRTQIDELSRLHAEASHDSFHDELTGLPNRKRLRDRFNIAAKLCGPRHQQLFLLFLDLDNFKHINDAFGHAVGDKVLQSVATRLQAIMRATDTACRYGGDEFVVLLSDIDATTSAADVAMRIRDRLATPYEIEGTHIDLQTSVGIAIYPDDCQSWEGLVQHADAAMYRARLQHRQEVTH